MTEDLFHLILYGRRGNMKAFLLVVSIAVVFAVPYIQGQPELREPKRTGKTTPCPCPPTMLPEDLSDEAMLKSVRSRLAKLFMNNTKATLTANGKKMQRVITTMLNSDSPTWRSRAWSSASWAWGWLPYNNTNPLPSLCAYARIINATVQYERSLIPRDTTSLNAALDEIGKASLLNFKAIGNTALVAAMCTPTPPTFTPGNCYNNGSTYLIDEIWNTDSYNLPKTYEDHARLLYPSKNYTDQVLAVTTTATASKPFADIMSIYNVNLQMETLGLLTIGPLPQCCCTPLTDRLNVLYALHEAELQRTINIIKDMYATRAPIEESE